MATGFIVAAPASGSGKTTLTLGLLRHFRNAGVAVATFKVGPDFIDPAFHEAASGRLCYNLDIWAMREETVGAVIDAACEGAELVIGEGAMGLFDGAPDGRGSSADAAVATGWPIVLVVDVRGQAASAAALLHGFATFRRDVPVSAVIFNNVGGSGHARLLKQACGDLGVPIVGFVPRAQDCALPNRHLGLVQASEHANLEAFLARVAGLVARHIDAEALRSVARPARTRRPLRATPVAPFGQRIAVARDQAFTFAYPHLLEGWRAAGAEVVAFSPLADEPPPIDADAVFLPGGYPELHAGRLAANTGFMDGLRRAAARSAKIYGECGGYMVLGEALIDGDGRRHRMAGLLGVETSFAERRMHLGYRSMRTLAASPLGPAGVGFKGHEFHFASVVREEAEPALFACTDALGGDLGAYGCVRGTAAGSFLHIIDAG